MKKPVYIIAEAGVNHNGDINIAEKMIDVASASGADAIKFQTFKAEHLASKNSTKAEYQKNTTDGSESQLEMLRKLELDKNAHEKLVKYCWRKKICFLSTPFDLYSIDLLVALGLQTLKIPSGEITNLPYLRKISGLKKKIILSTGMAIMEEIAAAINVLLAGGTLPRDLSVLHCNTEYPTPFEDANLTAMQTIQKAFPEVSVGYSDHTPGFEASIAAVALGAEVIEKHFTLDKNMKGPDHKASLEPLELQKMISAIRNVEKALGDGVKKPSPSEMKNRSVARKSIVATMAIREGDLLTESNVTTKRPGTGISPMRWDEIVGTRAIKDYQPDDLI
jgi:N,N'-diacetyllegionaminate synthase